VHVIPPADFFEARRCTYIPTVPTVYRGLTRRGASIASP
jgi:hypothetical protein